MFRALLAHHVGLQLYKKTLIQGVRKRLYPFLFFFLGSQCVESGVSCTDCY
jgi:hypothetical protein